MIPISRLVYYFCSCTQLLLYLRWLLFFIEPEKVNIFFANMHDWILVLNFTFIRIWDGFMHSYLSDHLKSLLFWLTADSIKIDEIELSFMIIPISKQVGWDSRIEEWIVRIQRRNLWSTDDTRWYINYSPYALAS